MMRLSCAQSPAAKERVSARRRRRHGTFRMAVILGSLDHFGQPFMLSPRSCYRPSPAVVVVAPRYEAVRPVPGLQVEVRWEDLGLTEPVARAVRRMGYDWPTVAQASAVPKLVQGSDCVIHAATGSGKTLAYLVSIFERVSASRQAAQAAVIVPSRELGLQVAGAARHLAKHLNMQEPFAKRKIKVMSLLEGSRLRRQRAWAWAEPPQVLVGNPRQVCEMLAMGGLRCAELELIIVDEVDVFFLRERTEERSYLASVLTESSSESRQTIFVSATVDQPRHFVKKLAQMRWCSSGNAPTYIPPSDALPPSLDHFSRRLDDPTKRVAVALAVLRRLGGLPAILFCDESRPLYAIASALQAKLGCNVAILDPADNFLDRANAMRAFRDARAGILLATDLAARGIDLPRIRLVLNFDFPANAFAYLHRAGRASRAGAPGLVVTLVEDKERFALRRIANFLRISEVLSLAHVEKDAYAVAKEMVRTPQKPSHSSLEST